MKTIKKLINSTKTRRVSTENIDLIAIHSAGPKTCRLSAVSFTEAVNSIEEKYYNKASGCSVKAQKDNLFDYYSYADN